MSEVWDPDRAADNDWFVGTGPPPNELPEASIGDFYLDKATGGYYRRLTPGSRCEGGGIDDVWFLGPAPPPPVQLLSGSDPGDFYLDELTGNLYRWTPEADGGYGSGVLTDVTGSFVMFGGNCIADWGRMANYLRGPIGCQNGLTFKVDDCFCWQDVDSEGYGSVPSYEKNPAPWYDPAYPASNEFLGVFITEVGGLDNATYTRTVTKSAAIGGSFGRMQYGHRELSFTGYLVAASCRGMEYGKRWLNLVVQGNRCDPCNLGELQVRVYCPTSKGDCTDDGLYLFKRVGVLDAPRYEPVSLDTRCAIMKVTWAMASELPWIFGRSLGSCEMGFTEAIANGAVALEPVDFCVTCPDVVFTTCTGWDSCQWDSGTWS